MRVPLAVDLNINQFNGATITEMDSGITNGVVEKRGEVFHVTQRPSIDVFEDASTHISDARGRAIHYWTETGGLYIVNDGTLYKDSQSNSISTSPTAGTQKCKFVELGDTLILLDAENDQGFRISNADSVAEITDTDFPPKQTPAVGLAHGGVALDGYLFVLGTNGTIYNSNNGDATAWTAIDYIEAERDPDGGVYLGKHHDNLIAFGSRTIEFFHDAGNTTGSPLARRQDVAYQIGCADGQSVWEEGDRIFFVGANFSGSLGVYAVENFSLSKVSNASLDSFLTQSVVKSGYSVVGSGWSAHGHTFYLLTFYLTPSDIEPYLTLCFDSTIGFWYVWETSVNGLSKLPLVNWSTRSGVSSRYGEGILSNGDLITLNDNLIPQDTLLASTYVTTGYVADGYVATTGSSGTAISMAVRTGQGDGGASRYKKISKLRYVGDLTPNSQTLTVKWAKENNSSFSDGVTTDTSVFQPINRVGRARRVNFDLTYAGTDQVRLEALEAVVQ